LIAAPAGGQLGRSEADEVLRLVAAAEAADGVSPFSEHLMLHLRHGGDATSRDLLLRAGDVIAGYAHVDPTGSGDSPGGASGELVIHPGHRRHGYGRALVDALLADASTRPLRLWAHGDRPAAAALARSAGFQRFRGLWQLHRSLREPLPEPVLPEGVTVRGFVIGRDEKDWLRVNARAFAHHPEQGGWTAEDLSLREQQAWFDPDGFFLAERDGRLVGFHWTKIHKSGTGPENAGQGRTKADSIGEVYVVGVDPDQQGTGLGRALTLVGLKYLRDRGLAEVMLYADESNRPAIHLYESLGFTHYATDVMYAHD
jgi:mycothiol synthase